ncbi:MAG: LamG domain-containing protein, partial [Bacteroidia bacterium]
MKVQLHSAAILIKSVGLIFMFIFFIPGPLKSSQPVPNGQVQSLSFNKINSSVSFENSKAGLDSGNSMSVSVWVKLNHHSYGKKTGIITLASNSVYAGQFWLLENNAQFEFCVQNATAQKTSVRTHVPVKPGTWNHVAGVYTGDELKIYLNGQLIETAKAKGNINQYRGDFRLLLGSFSSSPDSSASLAGSMDEVSLWKVALDVDQVRKIMCRKLNGKEYGLLDYWSMNEAEGAKVPDLGPARRNGTAEGVTIVSSGAPVGDESVYTYGGASLILAHPEFNDSLVITNFSRIPAGLHIYRVDAFPQDVSQPETYSGLFASYYFGVFIVEPSGESYEANWYYKGHKGIGDNELLDIAVRRNNSEKNCNPLNSMHDENGEKLVAENQKMSNEYILGLRSKGLSADILNFDAVVGENFVEVKWMV